MQFIGHDECGRPAIFAQRLVAIEHAHEVVGGIERCAELDIARVGAWRLRIRAATDNALTTCQLQVVVEGIAVEVGILEI